MLGKMTREGATDFNTNFTASASKAASSLPASTAAASLPVPAAGTAGRDMMLLLPLAPREAFFFPPFAALAPEERQCST